LVSHRERLPKGEEVVAAKRIDEDFFSEDE